METILYNSDADNFLSNFVFSGSEPDSYDDITLKWDTPSSYNMYLVDGFNYFKILESSKPIDDNYILLGSSCWIKSVKSINFFKLNELSDSIVNAPGYGDEFLGNPSTEELFKSASHYFISKSHQLISKLNEVGFNDIKSVNMYKGITYIVENDKQLEYSFIIPVSFISMYYNGRVISCFIYKNGLTFIIEHSYNESGSDNNIDDLLKSLNENLKYIFNESI